ncbi:hypothetical protein CEXT_103641 [Caerostris extrusa]|uniref:Uncharacterized protein n=1 Tax=Caerostris extrusa TaxID=172846 RepID=A0AAV4XVI2_CAEEX|nr:hypothetical protein CEXT_103641 [Caerostris extrusa]
MKYCFSLRRTFKPIIDEQISFAFHTEKLHFLSSPKPTLESRYFPIFSALRIKTISTKHCIVVLEEFTGYSTPFVRELKKGYNRLCKNPIEKLHVFLFTGL